ncbi:unnamed protein product, partial [Schistosoma curassoni]|uniref:t-SNARE coiled-coil homology domain-containing protein n=1 Tax=Schistosoma curassoni TaxID=6186 RepID=A0A183JER8_9TREM
MDDTDPYFCMQDEVFKNLQLAKTLYEDWRGGSNPGDQKLLTKIRQTIKNIEWDLMDLQETEAQLSIVCRLLSSSPNTVGVLHGFLNIMDGVVLFSSSGLCTSPCDMLFMYEETIGAVENNPIKFRLSDNDISARRQFLTEAKNVVKNVKNCLNSSDNGSKRNDSPIDFTVHIAPRPSSSPPSTVLCNGDLKVNDQTTNKTQSSKRINSHIKKSSPSSNIYSIHYDPLTEQKQLLYEQDNRLDQLGTTISNLKGMSQRIGDELGDQVVLLDDFNNEM